MSTSTRPILHTDFDGTAVEIATGIANARKYPLVGIPGFRSFIEGVSETGVQIGQIVSRRPDDFFGQRRRVTERSVEDMGMADFFGHPSSIYLAGKFTISEIWKKESERLKAGYVASFARDRVVGMIDDKPHKVGTELISSLEDLDVNPRTVLLGVVKHAKSIEYMTRLWQSAEDRRHRVEELTGGLGFRISNQSFELDVFQLPEYSFEAGQAFGSMLNKAAGTV